MEVFENAVCRIFFFPIHHTGEEHKAPQLRTIPKSLLFSTDYFCFTFQAHFSPSGQISSDSFYLVMLLELRSFDTWDSPTLTFNLHTFLVRKMFKQLLQPEISLEEKESDIEDPLYKYAAETGSCYRDHRIQNSLAQTFKDHLVHCPCCGLGHLSAEEVAQSPVQPDVQELRAWSIHTFSRLGIYLPRCQAPCSNPIVQEMFSGYLSENRKREMQHDHIAHSRRVLSLLCHGGFFLQSRLLRYEFYFLSAFFPCLGNLSPQLAVHFTQ